MIINKPSKMPPKYLTLNLLGELIPSWAISVLAIDVLKKKSDKYYKTQVGS